MTNRHGLDIAGWIDLPIKGDLAQYYRPVCNQLPVSQNRKVGAAKGVLEIVIGEIAIKGLIEKCAKIAKLPGRISTGQSLNRKVTGIHDQILGQRFSRIKRATMCR